MKLRSGFVSNSSSSSFIVLDDENLIPSEIKRVKLNDEQKKRLVMEGKIKNIDRDIYLTEYVSDGFDFSLDNDGVIEYHYGSHCGPYEDDCYDEIGENVWMYKGYWITPEEDKWQSASDKLDKIVEGLKVLLLKGEY